MVFFNDCNKVKSELLGAKFEPFTWKFPYFKQADRSLRIKALDNSLYRKLFDIFKFELFYLKKYTSIKEFKNR